MSIKLLYSSEKTNSFRPCPWHWPENSVPEFRGAGFKHQAVLAVSEDYRPDFVGTPPSAGGYTCPQVSFDQAPSKLTMSQNLPLLTSCVPEDDEQIMLITLRGGFRGGYSRIEAVGCEMLFQRTSSGSCVKTGHIIIRLTQPTGYLFAETGRRCDTGLVEIFSWAGYQTMSTEEFEKWHKM